MCVHVGVAERQRGEAIRVERAAEGMAETEARPGESQAAGGTHPQERKTQEGDGETQISFMSVINKYQHWSTSNKTGQY